MIKREQTANQTAVDVCNCDSNRKINRDLAHTGLSFYHF